VTTSAALVRRALSHLTVHERVSPCGIHEYFVRDAIDAERCPHCARIAAAPVDEEPAARPPSKPEMRNLAARGEHDVWNPGREYGRDGMRRRRFEP
jgi:hypothetical protein